MIPSLRLFAVFLPVVCLSGVMSGYFTAANRIGTLAAVEVAEQLCSMVVTLASLFLWAGKDAERSCLCVVLGGGVSACVALTALVWLRVREKSPSGQPIPVRQRLLHAAVPLAWADVVRSCISTTLEHMLVPKRLSLFWAVANPHEPSSASGQQVWSFRCSCSPPAFSIGLSELLIPEMARCHCAGEDKSASGYLLQQKPCVPPFCMGCSAADGCFFPPMRLCLRLYGNSSGGDASALVLPCWHPCSTAMPLPTP